MTYNEAYNKIIDAYFRDEIEPFDPEFCFCGTLCGNSKKWYGCTMECHFDSHGYTGDDFVKMERALLMPLPTFGETNEDELFAGMSAALDVLKQIHIDRGEIIDEPQQFTQRKPISK